jgi:hypothetical protein
MKMLIVIPLEVIVAVLAAACLLALLGAHVKPIEPAVAGGAAALAAVVGASPMLRTGGKSLVATVQFALACTVIHMMLTGILAATLVIAGAVSIRGQFVYWLIGSYWISLAVLVWQLRRIIVARAQLAKAQG